MVFNLIFFLLLVHFVFTGLFIAESLKLASAVTTTDSTGTASTVENKTVSVNGPDTTLYESAIQEILTTQKELTTRQYSTVGNGSGGFAVFKLYGYTKHRDSSSLLRNISNITFLFAKYKK